MFLKQDYGETSDEERPLAAVAGAPRVVTTNQEAVTVRIEQPGGSRSHQLVAEVHVVPANSEVIVGEPREEPRELPREQRPSESEVVVIHPDTEDELAGAAAAEAAVVTSSPQRSSPNRQKKSKREYF